MHITVATMPKQLLCRSDTKFHIVVEGAKEVTTNCCCYPMVRHRMSFRLVEARRGFLRRQLSIPTIIQLLLFNSSFVC